MVVHQGDAATRNRRMHLIRRPVVSQHPSNGSPPRRSVSTLWPSKQSTAMDPLTRQRRHAHHAELRMAVVGPGHQAVEGRVTTIFDPRPPSADGFRHPVDDRPHLGGVAVGGGDQRWVPDRVARTVNSKRRSPSRSTSSSPPVAMSYRRTSHGRYTSSTTV